MELIVSPVEVRQGDAVRLRLSTEGSVMTVVKCERVGDGCVRIIFGHPAGVMGVFSDETRFVLVRRPREGGVSKRNLLLAIEECSRRLAGAISDSLGSHMHDHIEDPDEVMAELRGLMDAYELSKPEVKS